jgi:hypothetical protein
LKTAAAHGNHSLYFIPVSVLSLFLSAVLSHDHRLKRSDIFSVSAPHLKRLNGHSPLRACDHMISAVGMPNRARFDQSYIPVFFSLSLLNIILNPLLIIFRHKKAIPPIMATFPTPHQNFF